MPDMGVSQLQPSQADHWNLPGHGFGANRGAKFKDHWKMLFGCPRRSPNAGPQLYAAFAFVEPCVIWRAGIPAG